MGNKLGVEAGEEWRGNDGEKYKITETGEFIRIDETNWFNVDDWIPRLLTGKLKPIWEPKEDEFYYIPNIYEEKKFTRYKWINDIEDNKYARFNIVFKTKEEAITCTEKILEVIKDV